MQLVRLMKIGVEPDALTVPLTGGPVRLNEKTLATPNWPLKTGPPMKPGAGPTVAFSVAVAPGCNASPWPPQTHAFVTCVYVRNGNGSWTVPTIEQLLKMPEPCTFVTVPGSSVPHAATQSPVHAAVPLFVTESVHCDLPFASSII